MNNKGFGVIKEAVPHIRDYDYEAVCGSPATEFPEEFEISRENTGTLKNQGTVGACVAEVIVQIAEELWRRQLGESEEHSEGHAYSEFRSDGSRGYGLIPTKALDCWVSKGTLPKKYFDELYEMPDLKDIVAKYPEFEEIAKRYRLSGYVSLNYANKEKRDLAIKDALTKYQYGLVAVADDYFGESHCIMLTGWNDNTSCYKFKNSWGEEYRDKGFGEIPKEEINQVYLPLLEDIKLPFADVPEDAWYYKYVKNMHFNGFMQGTSENTFEPDKPMTRAEVATLIYRVLQNVDDRFDIVNREMNRTVEQIKKG